MTGNLQFGDQLWAQATDWPEFRDARGRGRGGRLGLGLDVGPPAGDLRPVGAADLRGLDGARRRRPAVTADPARAAWSARTRSAIPA